MTKIHTGYLIGRALEQRGPGPWWSYILIVESFHEAARQARTLAATDGVRVWLHRSGDDYELLA